MVKRFLKYMIVPLVFVSPLVHAAEIGYVEDETYETISAQGFLIEYIDFRVGEAHVHILRVTNHADDTIYGSYLYKDKMTESRLTTSETLGEGRLTQAIFALETAVKAGYRLSVDEDAHVSYQVSANG